MNILFQVVETVAAVMIKVIFSASVTNFEHFLFQVVETVAAALRSVSVTEESVKAAKKALALEIGEAALQVSIFYYT